VHAAAAEVDRLFPLSLGSQGSCTIGGNLSTNAGGTNVLAYGNARDLVLGLEVVLPTGEIWHGLKTLRKDNTGYDLKALFLGAEGTLGLITAAALKLFPKPKAQEVAFVGIPDPHAALRLLSIAKTRASGSLTAFEIMPRIAIDMCVKHVPGTRDPVATAAPWYLLIELSTGGTAEAARAMMEGILEAGFEVGDILDATIADSGAQAAMFWHIRHGLSEAQRPEGGSIKHDVSVPVALVPDFLDRAIAAVLAMVPGCRPVPFGHMGDGNIHFNVSQPIGMDKAAFIDLWDAMNDRVHEIVLSMGGSISAEHGIGRLKRDALPGVKSPVEMAMMRSLKRAFDPKGLMNPGRVLGA
jgi:FAD/FMN-containing dehydrogenase